jgi:hypothetical protein
MYIPNFVTQGTVASFLWGGYDAVEMRIKRSTVGNRRMLTEQRNEKHKISTIAKFITVLFFATCFGLMESHHHTIKDTKRKIIKFKI